MAVHFIELPLLLNILSSPKAGSVIVPKVTYS